VTSTGAIAGEDGEQFGVPHHEVAERLAALVGRSVRPRHEAVRIHPFENGNGRWARLLANMDRGASEALIDLHRRFAENP
jgi:fido (protein-threonine AMPylation protein)